MAVALEGIALAELVAVLVLLACMLVLLSSFRQLAAVFDVSILGQRPFHFVAAALEATIIRVCNAGVKELQNVATVSFHGIVWSLKLQWKGLQDLASGTTAAFSVLWGHKIPALISAALSPVHAAISAAKLELRQLAQTVDGIPGDIAKDYKAADSAMHKAIAGEIGTAFHAVETDAAAALHGFERTIRADLHSAVAPIEAIAHGVEGELNNLDQLAGAAGLAGLIAAMPAVGALVQTIATEAGLDNALCRSKVKGICTTNPLGWAQMLEGLLLLEGGLHLGDLVAEARKLISEAEPIIREVA